MRNTVSWGNPILCKALSISDDKRLCAVIDNTHWL